MHIIISVLVSNYTTQKIKVVTLLNFDIFFYILRDFIQTWNM
jgi:hypothetical protein